MPRAKATTRQPQPRASQGATAQAMLRQEHAGKWLAWSEDESRILAVGDTSEEVRAAAERAGATHFIYDWVPPTDDRQIGGGEA